MKRWKAVCLLVAFAFVLLTSCLLRFHLIAGRLPYISFFDEPALTNPALNILQTGDFNPHYFKYPSLPIYLTAIGFTLGYLNCCSQMTILNTDEIESVSYPYYSHPQVVFPARVIFATLSVLAMALIAVIGYKLFKGYSILLLTPLLLFLSPFYLNMSWTYINVDIVGTFLITSVLLYIISNWDNNNFPRRAIIPGLLCGLVVGSKYSLLLIILPCLITIAICCARRFVVFALSLFVSMVIGFLAVVPFALLDFSSFINHVGAEVSHYSRGHIGATVSPGLPHIVFYLQTLISDFGWASAPLAIIGLWSLFTKDWKKALVLISFPAAHLIFFGSQSVAFTRNILPLFIVYALLVALGIVKIVKYLAAWLERLPPFKQKQVLQFVSAAATVGVIYLAFLPWGTIADAFDMSRDSRNIAINWIEANIPVNSVILVPYELDMDIRPLTEYYTLRKVPLLRSSIEEIEQILNDNASNYLLRPHYRFDHRFAERYRTAGELNRLFIGKVIPLIRIGKNLVFTNYSPATVHANPEFSIARIKPQARWISPSSASSGE